MAHSCPECDTICHCAADISISQFDEIGEQENCDHCEYSYLEDYEYDDFDNWTVNEEHI